MFIFEREHVHVLGDEAEKEEERILRRLRVVSTEPDRGLELTDCEFKVRYLNQRSHPAP